MTFALLAAPLVLFAQAQVASEARRLGRASRHLAHSIAQTIRARKKNGSVRPLEEEGVSVKHALQKVVIPAAGLGTRFLPATKAMPKEMLCLVDKPLIQYGVEEAVAAGCTEIIIITGRGKSTMEDHFDSSPELEASLEAKHKTALLEIVHDFIVFDPA